MKASVTVFILMLCLSVSQVFIWAGTTPGDRYNLNFSNPDIHNFKWQYLQVPYVYIDSLSETIDGKYPMCFTEGPVSVTKNPFLLTISQQLFVPQKLSYLDTIRVSIHNKCYNLSEAQLKLFCMDEHDNLLYVDSIDINNDSCWTYQHLTMPSFDTHKMLLGIYAIGYDLPHPKSRSLQKLWIDRIDVTINDRHIEDYNYCPKPLEEDLNTDKLTPLSLSDEDLFRSIPIPDSVMILGIGESMHGSKTMNEVEVQLVKGVIKNSNCNLLLVEANMYEMLLANLFIHGFFDEDDMEVVQEVSAYTAQFSPDVFCDFLLWLRKYNETATDKISIYGILDINYDVWANPLFDYLYAFYNSDNRDIINPILRLLYDKNPDVLAEVKQASALQQIMGQNYYSDFVYALTKATVFYEDDKQILFSINDLMQRRWYRDESMFDNAAYFISKNKDSRKTACIIAHNGHIDCVGRGFPHLRSMGYYLKEKYGAKYFTIGVFAGLGNLLSRDPFEKGQAYCEKKLPTPLIGSIEAFCSNAPYSYFYYPTNALSNSNFYYREIGNTYIESNQYLYGNLRNRIDGLVFLSQTEASDQPIYTDDMKLTINRVIKHTSVLKKFE